VRAAGDALRRAAQLDGGVRGDAGALDGEIDLVGERPRGAERLLGVAQQRLGALRLGAHAPAGQQTDREQHEEKPRHGTRIGAGCRFRAPPKG
jgi:hypothetical protein